MKKLLMYFPENKLAPKGGPAGYLYNLKCEIAKGDRTEPIIEFLPPVEEGSEIHRFTKKYTPVRGQEFVRAIKMIKLAKKKVWPDDGYLKYDAIHFHSTEDMYFCRDFLNKYKGHVFLTSHTPCASYVEKMERLNKVDICLFRKQLKVLEEIDAYAFGRADHIIFPCLEAEEPYYHTWANYNQIRVKEKYEYIPSGINRCMVNRDREYVRAQYEIPEDAFVVSFVGRHNEIKGYHSLRLIGEKAIKENVWFLIAGKETPLKRLKNKLWIEAGWTNDPHSLIAASDVFILPNKETYFDLVLLEVLSLGKIVITTDTGGNKYFKNFNQTGIFYYQTIVEAVAQIMRVKAMSITEREQLEHRNFEIYNKNFTTGHFAEKYFHLLNSLL